MAAKKPLIDKNPPRYPFYITNPNPVTFPYRHVQPYALVPSSYYPGYGPLNLYHSPFYSYAPNYHNFVRYHSSVRPPNATGGRPLFSSPPPLLPLPAHYRSYNIALPGNQQKSSEVPKTPIHDLSVGHNSSPEKPTTTPFEEQPSKHVTLPLMPSIEHTSISPKCTKVFTFLRDRVVPKDLKNSEMLIRGYIHNFDDSGSKGYLKSGSNLTVEISKDVMYVMGEKLKKEEKMCDALAMWSKHQSPHQENNIP